MIEAVEERQALVEVSLRLWRTCRDRPRVGTQTFKQRFLGSVANERERQAKKDATNLSHCFHNFGGRFNQCSSPPQGAQPRTKRVRNAELPEREIYQTEV